MKREQRGNINRPEMTENLGGTGGATFSVVPPHHTTHEAGGSDIIIGLGGSGPIFSATAPVSTTLHMLWIDTTSATEKYWDGFVWQVINRT